MGNEDALAGALGELLERLPHAVVAAIGDDGLFTEPPATLPFDGRVVVTGRAATELVEAGHRATVIEAWERVLADGRSSATVPLPGGDHLATMHLLDVRDEHGVFAMVLDAGDDPPAIVPVPSPPTTGMAKVVRVRKDATAIVRWVDDAVVDVLGWRPEELVDRRSLDLIHPDDQELAITAWMDMLPERGLTTRARLRHARGDGGWTWMDVSNHNCLDDVDPRVDCVMVDVSEEVAAVEALHASEQLLRRLTDSMPVGVFHIDTDGRLHLANPRLHEMLGTDETTDRATMLDRAVDHVALDRAIAAALAGTDVDMDLEIQPLGGDDLRRCTLALRTLLTDGQITGAVGCLTDVTDSVRLHEELRRRATVDDLTGCLNRESLLEALEQVLASQVDLAVVYIDIDEFKRVNDGLGHAAGDEVLQAVGARLRAAVRTHDAVGRMGGDEFIVVCPGLGSSQRAEELRDRLALVLRDPVSFRRQQIDVSASIGMAWAPAGADTDPDGLIGAADSAMYSAKRSRTG